MKGFTKQRHNPLELIAQYWPDANTSHITYDPNMKDAEYHIIRQSGGDGTLSFTIEMLQEGLLNLVNGSSYYKKTEPEWAKVKGIKYTVGDVKHATVFGMIYLKCSETHKYAGQRERTRIPVKCEYVY